MTRTVKTFKLDLGAPAAPPPASAPPPADDDDDIAGMFFQAYQQGVAVRAAAMLEELTRKLALARAMPTATAEQVGRLIDSLAAFRTRLEAAERAEQAQLAGWDRHVHRPDVEAGRYLGLLGRAIRDIQTEIADLERLRGKMQEHERALFNQQTKTLADHSRWAVMADQTDPFERWRVQNRTNQQALTAAIAGYLNLSKV